MQDHVRHLIRESLITATLFIAILAIMLSIPAFAIISLFLLPLPFIVFSYRHGWKKATLLGIIVMAIAAIISLSLILFILPQAFLPILTGILIGQAIRGKRHPYEVWAQGALGVALGLTVLYFTTEFVFDISFATEYQLMIKESLHASTLILDAMGMDWSARDLEIIEEQMLMILDLIPAILLIISIFVACVVQWLGYRTLRHVTKERFYFPRVRTFNLPKFTLWLFLVTMLIAYFEVSPIINGIVLNFSTLLGLLFSMQGISFVFHYVYMTRRSKWIAILSVVLSIIFLPIGLYLTRILGIIDVGFMMRQRIK
ncbi:Uncharacterized conserved protein YybS, DUF2232 family [Amphibacillus marinus]|uniref:Uncharacterized conserved protein YybS, DUF2232 family n=1 Tax=Amphibacillus marinus TaxID=872970 RepID=A0A1H8PJF2_9BACI|nr:DUF2232 domain-containing protein [Amphibacillus marinus]SEO41901.1 Uncharacterized conserved protein YybS, DUF2232 family [Amphibacillus marinus]